MQCICIRQLTNTLHATAPQQWQRWHFHYQAPSASLLLILLLLPNAHCYYVVRHAAARPQLLILRPLLLPLLLCLPAAAAAGRGLTCRHQLPAACASQPHLHSAHVPAQLHQPRLNRHLLATCSTTQQQRGWVTMQGSRPCPAAQLNLSKS
jgi:hypothetical protein